MGATGRPRNLCRAFEQCLPVGGVPQHSSFGAGGYHPSCGLLGALPWRDAGPRPFSRSHSIFAAAGAGTSANASHAQNGISGVSSVEISAA